MDLRRHGGFIAVRRYPGHGHFHLLDGIVDEFQVRPFRHIYVHEHGPGIDGRKKFHRFFNTDFQHPDLEQKHRDDDRSGQHRQFVGQGLFENPGIGGQKNPLDRHGFFSQRLEFRG